MYTVEKHTQILLALMKFHAVRKIIISSQSINMSLVKSLKSDSYFTVYSAVDERSAAYMACGLAAESGEPVVVACMGATAARNYIPGLTEAFYRRLPILAVTSALSEEIAGHVRPQVIDKSQVMKDLVCESVLVNCVHSKEEEIACALKVNKALIALRKNGGGPVHINLEDTGSKDFSAEKLPDVKGIRYVGSYSYMPSLERYGRIVILAGAHEKWTARLQELVEKFCEVYGAVVFTYHGCNYRGKYSVNHVVRGSACFKSKNGKDSLVIYIGSMPRSSLKITDVEFTMWRVNPDGEIYDPEGNLKYLFGMSEERFFDYYVNIESCKKSVVSQINGYQGAYDRLRGNLPTLPFSHTWLASVTAARLPESSILHMSGADVVRAWEFFDLPEDATCFLSDGVTGADGQLSALLGESLVSPEKLHFGIVDNQAVFYDMNALGNRHVGHNLRLLIVNAKRDEGVPNVGSFDKTSPEMIRHYFETLGFSYLSAKSKEEYIAVLDGFMAPVGEGKSVVLEVFIDMGSERIALNLMEEALHKI